MTLDGAINFYESDIYTIYNMNSASAGQYCVVLPKNNNGMYNMLVDLHMKSLFDGVSNGSKTKEDIVNEIGKEYNNIITKYKDAILVIPMLDETNYVNIITTNDKQKMFDEVKKIGAITSELYKKITESGINKSNIDQKIIIIEKDENDKKFVEWLIGQMPNFVSGVSLSEFNVSNDNPFMGNSNSNDIFGAPVVENSNVTPVETINATPNFNNIEPTPAPVDQTVAAQPEIPNLFGEEPQKVEQPVEQPQPEVQNNIPVSTPVQQPGTDTIAEPKPVENVSLDQTVTFTPVSDVNVVNTTQPTAAPVDNNVTNNATNDNGQAVKKSNGFVNLAIMLVVLIGVTLVSIELGKFLYNTYGV